MLKFSCDMIKNDLLNILPEEIILKKIKLIQPLKKEMEKLDEIFLYHMT